eukprot:CAMPEP_0119021514 /NCGR_PEP_ID=MMETSP1176-20130426/26139_1 /TAXON_ID=265551 /ORGANISM="Synedropsis recta cf, Strain CCMP1620" /LENGTH=440 /DNA_ID=CAMNT_0006976137 /DNA_START=141 /DNA_END=1463 /DNA_ORIENTATION=+
MNNEGELTNDMHMRLSMMGASESVRFLLGVGGEEEEHKKDTTKASAKLNDVRLESVRQIILKKKLTQAFKQGEENTILKVLDEIDRIEEREAKKGFNETNFTWGVMNFAFIAFVFGAFPQHFWLAYLAESAFFIPMKFRNLIRAKPLNETLYYLDFCWMMNFSGVTILIVFLLQNTFDVIGSNLSDTTRKEIFMGAFGIACGPLLGATALLPFVAFIFHDINTMTNVIIHALPPMLFYTLRWYPEELQQAWPNMFHLDYIQDLSYYPPGGMFFSPGTGLGSIAGNTVFIYLCWFIPYTSWMLLIGMDLPSKVRKSMQQDGKVEFVPKTPKYDTVFHSFWRTGSCATFGSLWNRPKEVSQAAMAADDYEVRDFLLYMTLHMGAVVISIPTLGYGCFVNQYVHTALLVGVLWILVNRGAKRYTYYTTSMYGKMMRREFLGDP